MNIVNKLLLKILLLPIALYNKLGVDTWQLYIILSTKLLIDDRRPTTFQQISHRQKQKVVNTATLTTMFISLVLGMVFLVCFSLGANVTTQLTFFFSMFIFMLAATLISDFTSVLIDVRDNYIILPKPVNDKTVVVARLLHILIHICKIVLPLTLPGVIYMFYKYGIGAGMLLFFLCLFAVLFTLFLINAIYIFILRITTPQKFQNIISYFQVVFAILLYSSYQLFPRMIDRMGTSTIDFANYPAMLLAPPYWFAVAWHSIYTLSGNAVAAVLTAASFSVPVLCVIVVIKYFAPSFNRKLALISSSDGGSVSTSGQKNKQQKITYPQWLAKIVTKSGAETTGFLFTWKMTARSKDFRMKVYPAAGYLIVYVFIMFFTLHDLSLQSIRQQTVQGRIIVIVALYMSSLLVLIALNQMIYSDKFKAAWIFYTAPVGKPGTIIVGAVKSILLKFYMPMILVIAGIGFALIGISFLPNLLLAMLNVIFISLMATYVSFIALPFSRPQNVGQQSGSLIKNLFRTLLLLVMGIIHFELYAITPVIIILTVLAAVAAWYLTDSISKISWSKLAAADDTV